MPGRCGNSRARRAGWKTDAIDADVLAHYAEALKPEQHVSPDLQTRKLRALLARGRQRMDMIVAEGIAHRTRSMWFGTESQLRYAA
jgi:transposase